MKALRVLLIEDNVPLQNTTARLILRALGDDGVHSIDFAASAPAAIALLDAGDYDLVVSDFDLGATDGGQVLAHVHRSRPELARRFVFFTGSPAEPQRLHPHVIEKGLWPTEFAKELLAILYPPPAEATAP